MRDSLLTTRQAAELLNMSPGWLAKRRCDGRETIPFIKLGPKTVRYRREDILAFAERRQRHSTSDRGAE
jgi:hypothetical protein